MPTGHPRTGWPQAGCDGRSISPQDGILDAKNAFNSIHRRSFLKVIGERFPGLWNWAWSNYGAPTELYVRRDNLAPEIILSRSGTRQGDPLGAQYFALGLHPVLCLVASLLGTRGTLIAYCDDVHILCPPTVANEILSFSSLLPTARWGRVALARPSGSVLMGGGRGRGAHLGVSYVTHCFDTRGCLGRQDERRDHRRGVFTPIYPPWQVAYHQRVGISPIGSVIQHERSCGCAVNRHLGKTRTARSIDNPRTEPTAAPRTWRPGYSCVKTTERHAG